MLTALMFFTALITLATLLPVLRIQHWGVRSLDFPRLQISCLGLLLLVAHLCLLDLNNAGSWMLIGITGLCVGWQLWWILPYTALWPKQVENAINHHPDYQLSLLTSNVLTTNRNAQALIDLVQLHEPDVLVTLESDQWWEEQLAALEQDMPYTIKCPLDNLYGMHVYSRLPLLESEICFLVEDDVPSMHAQIQMRSGDKVRAHFLHPAPPSPTENETSTERDAELIIVGRNIADSEQPLIVTGDLNDVAWSDTTRLFRVISRLLDPRIGRGMFNTFHAKVPFFRWPLDHLFHSEHFTLRFIKRLPSIGSDHFPLLTCLTLPPQREPDHEHPEPDKQDRQLARSLAARTPASQDDVPEPGE